MRCTSFSVLNRKYRSLQCTWSLAYDYSWYLITANMTRERLMHLVLFFTYQFDIICTLIKKSNFIWFWCHFSQLNGYWYQYQWVEKNCASASCNSMSSCCCAGRRRLHLRTMHNAAHSRKMVTTMKACVYRERYDIIFLFIFLSTYKYWLSRYWRQRLHAN